ncbi:MAG: cupin domain-containing protein, partial [Deltaproteobacteria bacterium]|nr:cupin domain-containing protein [Deltaproteobacteria bacterium]
RDTARTPRLSACVTAVLAGYPWAPPLRGQTIQLPFQFRAPNGQNVIDRKLVSATGQGTIRLSVLADENNTGNAMASLVEVALASGATTGMRRADRAELWFFATPAELRGPDRVAVAVAAGDMVYVPKSGVREILAKAGAVTAMLAIVPGGREGAARAGALPTPEVSGWRAVPPGPVLLAAKAAKSYPRGPGKVTIFAEPSKRMTAPTIAAALLEFPAGMAVPEHVHDKETELLYVLSGTGTMIVRDAGRTEPVELAVTATSVVQIPPGAKHAFTATQNLRAVQIYTPAGPEQRFKVK